MDTRGFVVPGRQHAAGQGTPAPGTIVVGTLKRTSSASSWVRKSKSERREVRRIESHSAASSTCGTRGFQPRMQRRRRSLSEGRGLLLRVLKSAFEPLPRNDYPVVHTQCTSNSNVFYCSPSFFPHGHHPRVSQPPNLSPFHSVFLAVDSTSLLHSQNFPADATFQTNSRQGSGSIRCPGIGH